MPKTKQEKLSLAEVVAGLEKNGTKIGYTPREQQFFTTSNVAIDWICGGGLPVGKIVEISGKTGSGKTTLAIQSCVALQESGGIPVWLDYERAFDWEYARKLGLNTDEDKFIYIKPDSLEQGGDIAYQLVITGEVDLVIIDSIARMTTRSELEGEMADLTVADKAKALYKFTRKILNALDDNDCTLVFLNHLLDAINTSMPGVKTKITPGGNAVPYFASLRIECSLMRSITETDKTANAKYKALEIQMLCTKNRVAPPSRKVIVQNDFGSGFNQMRSVLEIVSELGLVTKSTWTTINDPELSEALGAEKYQSYDAFVAAVTANPEARGMLISKALQIVSGK